MLNSSSEAQKPLSPHIGRVRLVQLIEIYTSKLPRNEKKTSIMEILPANERMCQVLSPSADKTETVLKSLVIPNTKTLTRGLSVIE